MNHAFDSGEILSSAFRLAQAEPPIHQGSLTILDGLVAIDGRRVRIGKSTDDRFFCFFPCGDQIENGITFACGSPLMSLRSATMPNEKGQQERQVIFQTDGNVGKLNVAATDRREVSLTQVDELNVDATFKF